MAQPGASSISMQTFYDELSPYGRWIADPVYGYVWVPDVEPGFQPYGTRGHWVMTQYGNTWVSDYAWGWAPFHYGRWNYDAFYGWVWVPGQEWGPAWVAWRSGGGYYGWTPLGPGIRINATLHVPLAHWIFVPQRYITSPRLYSYYAPAPRVVRIYHNTTVINNYYNQDNRTYVHGPRAQEIEQHTRGKVPVYRVSNDSRPGRAVVRNGAVNMYRPEISSRNNDAPSRVVAPGNAPRTNRSVDANNRDRNERNNAAGLERSSRINRSSEERSVERSNPTRTTIEPSRPTRAPSPAGTRENRSNASRDRSPAVIQRSGSTDRQAATPNRNTPSQRVERAGRPAAARDQQRTQVTREQRRLEQPQRQQTQRQPSQQQPSPREQRGRPAR